MSDFLRRYQIGGELPDDEGDTLLNFYAGWLMGRASRRDSLVTNFDQARDFAIKVAEFIEERTKS